MASTAKSKEVSEPGAAPAGEAGAFDSFDVDLPLPEPLPEELAEALVDFDGDFRGPWLALGLDPEKDLEVNDDELRQAYRRAVRTEHPDMSKRADAELRFRRVRKAFALLSDEPTRLLLLEATERNATSFSDLDKESPVEAVAGLIPRAAALVVVVSVLGAAASSWLRGSTAKPIRKEKPAATTLYRTGAGAGPGSAGDASLVNTGLLEGS